MIKQLKSLISDGSFKDARKVVFIMRLNGDKRAEAVELLKQASIPDEGICGCGNQIRPAWNDFSLEYETAESCESCFLKIREDEEREKRELERQQFREFESKKDEYIEKLLKQSGVPNLYLNSSIDHIDESMRSKLNSASYYIQGDVGCGKTYLSVALLREFVKSFPVVRGYNGYYFEPKSRRLPIFVSVPELLLEIRHCFSQDSSIKEVEVVAKYSDTPFLILDDLGTEKSTEWSLQTLYLIVNRRSVEPQNITLVTSNLTLNQIAEKLGDRIASRIAGLCQVLELRGDDRRLGGTKS